MLREAIRTLITGTGLFGARVWADVAPPRATFPHVTIFDGVTTRPAVLGDGKTLYVARTVQVDLWEKLPDEDQTIAAAVYQALDGAKVLAGATALRVVDTQRLPEVDTNIAHRAITVETEHVPAAY